MKSKLSLRHAFTLSLACAALVACDGNFNFSDDGAVKGATVEEVIKGAADRMVQVHEDFDRTKARRESLLRIAKNAGVVDAGQKFISALESNPNYSNIKLKSKLVPGREEQVAVVDVSFELTGDVLVALQFLSEQKTVIGPFRMSRLPVLSDVVISRNGQPLRVFQSQEETFVHILNRDPARFSSQVAREVAAAAARERRAADCIKEVESREFEVDPGLSEPEKQKAVREYEQKVKRETEACKTAGVDRSALQQAMKQNSGRQ